MSDDVSPNFDVDAAVDELVGSGRFESREAVLRAGVRLVHEQAAHEQAVDLASVRAAVQRGIADAEAGRVMDVDQAFDELNVYIREMIDKRAA